MVLRGKTTTQRRKPLAITVGRIQKHPEGYAINVYRDNVRLASAYGGSPEDTQARAAVVVTAFQSPGFAAPSLSTASASVSFEGRS
jgi:hypothetical protein